MTRLTMILATSLGLALTATSVSAQATELDSDGDGVLSFVELTSAMPEMTEETFVTIDVNADGAIDAEELAAAQDAGLIPAQ